MRGAIPCSQCRDGPICKTQRGKRKAEEERGRWVKRYEIGVVVVWCAHPKLRQANTTLTHKGGMHMISTLEGGVAGQQKNPIFSRVSI